MFKDKEGLSEYKSYLEMLEKRTEPSASLEKSTDVVSSSNIAIPTANNSPSITPATVNFNQNSSTFNTTTSTITNITPEIPPHPSDAKPISEDEEPPSSMKSEAKTSLKSEKEPEHLKTTVDADYTTTSNNNTNTILSKPSETLKQTKSSLDFDKSTISEPIIIEKPPIEQLRVVSILKNSKNYRTLKDFFSFFLKRSSVKFSDQQLDDLDRVVKTQQTNEKTVNDSGLNSEAINTSLIDIDQIEKDVNDNDKDNDKSELDVNKTEHLETEKLDEKSILESFELPKFSMSEIFGNY